MQFKQSIWPFEFNNCQCFTQKKRLKTLKIEVIAVITPVNDLRSPNFQKLYVDYKRLGILCTKFKLDISIFRVKRGLCKFVCG